MAAKMAAKMVKTVKLNRNSVSNIINVVTF